MMSIALTVMVGIAGGLMLSDVGGPEAERSSWIQALALVLFVGPLVILVFGEIERVEPLWGEWALVIGSGSVSYLTGKFLMGRFGRHPDRDR